MNERNLFGFLGTLIVLGFLAFLAFNVYLLLSRP